MNFVMLRTFLMWCTIINGGILIVWTLAFLFAPNLVYRTQKRFVDIPQATFNTMMYAFIGAFKIIFLAFNLVPYLALLMATR